MRATFPAICAVCAFLIVPSAASAAPTSAEEVGMPNIEALGNQEPDRWQGRHHYLYDEEYQPGSATTGSAPADPRSCAGEPVRMQRTDGSTIVRRIRRCD